MEVIVAFGITFLVLIFSVYKGIFLAYPLCIGFIIFFITAMRKGYSFRDVSIMAYKGGKKSLIVIKIFMLIGAIMAIWMASGTVPAVVYYGVRLINPNLFILSAFLICCCVSFLIGTSLGTAGTVGIALVVIARGGGVNVAAAAGAIIAGAFFGDRSSSMSSSASLVAFLTDTDIYDNLQNMFKTCIVPFIISIAFFSMISFMYPLRSSGNGFSNLISKSFAINIFALIPAITIIVLAFFRVNVKLSMFISIIIAFLISIFMQHQTVIDCLRFIVSGYSMKDKNALNSIIKGGGIISMIKTSIIVLIPSAFAGIIEDSEMLRGIEAITEKAATRYEIYKNVAITSVITSVIGCSQTFAVILTCVLNKKAYHDKNIDNSVMAVDLENTAIMISGLFPWNLALLAPMLLLGADSSCIPFLFYIYAVPVCNLVMLKLRDNIKSRSY